MRLVRLASTTPRDPRSCDPRRPPFPPRLLACLQQDAFADDTVRMIKALRSANPSLQILLFSATFNERVKRFALKIVPDANQVGGGWGCWLLGGCLGAFGVSCKGAATPLAWP